MSNVCHDILRVEKAEKKMFKKSYAGYIQHSLMTYDYKKYIMT